jgi:hypothetical protein
MRWALYVTDMGEKRNVYEVAVRDLEGKRPLGIPMSRWKGNTQFVRWLSSSIVCATQFAVISYFSFGVLFRAVSFDLTP